jgi:NADH:ubiquinone oxidoreductase subunit 6 (subunit J)
VIITIYIGAVAILFLAVFMFLNLPLILYKTNHSIFFFFFNY